MSTVGFLIFLILQKFVLRLAYHSRALRICWVSLFVRFRSGNKDAVRLLVQLERSFQLQQKIRKLFLKSRSVLCSRGGV